MARIEHYFGIFMVLILSVIVTVSILYSFFLLVFRDGHGLAGYGNRGEFYMAE